MSIPSRIIVGDENLSMVVKAAGGGAIGVTVPLVVEYAAKGARLGATEEEPTKGVKISGVVGLVEAALGIGLAAYDEATGRIGLADADKALLASMGGAGLATGVGIIVLDELRKREMYTFQKEFPLSSPERGLQAPPREELLVEI